MSDTTRIVACVLWVGEFRKRSYSPLWVQRLRNMVARNLGEHCFVCLSNIEVEGVETIPLRDNLPGWWSKLELFRPGLFPEGSRVLAIDLDTVIVDDLEPHFTEHADAPFVALQAYRWGPTRIEEGKRVTMGVNSGTMAFTAGRCAERLYTDFRRPLMDQLRGDQDWLTEQLGEIPLFPRSWWARLRDCPKGPPEGCRIVHCMPWKNDVAAQKFPWVRKLWV